MQKKRRGLGSLIPDMQWEAPAQAQAAPAALPIESLAPGPYQPRHECDPERLEELARSIKEQGVLQPILVRHREGAWQVLAGWRRWQAAKMAGVAQVPVLLKDCDDRQALEIALVENIQREDLTPIEEAQGYQRLMEEFGHTQEALARAVGKSRSHIANQLRLLSLPKAVQDMVQAGALSAGHARALIGAPNVEALAQEVVAKGFNVRQTERRVRLTRPMPPRKGARRDAPVAKDADTLAIEHELSNLLGLRVTIHFRKSGGELVIHYETLDQLDDVLRRISGTAPHPKAP